MYSNSRNDLPRVAQVYGTIAAHTRSRASVLVVFVVFCVHMYSFAGLIRRTPPRTFSDTAITERNSDTTIFQLRAHWVRNSRSNGSENRSDMCPGGSRTLDFLRARRAPMPGFPPFNNKAFTNNYISTRKPNAGMVYDCENCEDLSLTAQKLTH